MINIQEFLLEEIKECNKYIIHNELGYTEKDIMKLEDVECNLSYDLGCKRAYEDCFNQLQNKIVIDNKYKEFFKALLDNFLNEVDMEDSIYKLKEEYDITIEDIEKLQRGL